MDSARFDSLTRSLTQTGSRRRALAALSGALGLFGLTDADDATAHDLKATCKKKSGEAKKKCLKKAKKHAAEHAATAVPTVPTPTCSDGIKNGSESDVDCGGSCPRCATGKACQGPGDCTSGLCQSQVCRVCTDISCTADITCTTLGCGTCNQATGKCRNP